MVDGELLIRYNFGTTGRETTVFLVSKRMKLQVFTCSWFGAPGALESSLIGQVLPYHFLPFLRCQRIRSDAAKFYVGQMSARMCNLCRMKGVENLTE